jgi:hypothetical protein
MKNETMIRDNRGRFAPKEGGRKTGETKGEKPKGRPKVGINPVIAKIYDNPRTQRDHSHGMKAAAALLDEAGISSTNLMTADGFAKYKSMFPAVVKGDDFYTAKFSESLMTELGRWEMGAIPILAKHAEEYKTTREAVESLRKIRLNSESHAIVLEVVRAKQVKR